MSGIPFGCVETHYGSRQDRVSSVDAQLPARSANSDSLVKRLSSIYIAPAKYSIVPIR